MIRYSHQGAKPMITTPDGQWMLASDGELLEQALAAANERAERAEAHPTRVNGAMLDLVDERDALRALMFMIAPCDGIREDVDSEACEVCYWLENDRCAVDGRELPGGDR